MSKMNYKFEMKIPVSIEYSERDDGSILIDAMAIPDENELYEMVDQQANVIKMQIAVRRKGCGKNALDKNNL